MNKIYKVIWSKAKNCYIVVSELAKACSKVTITGSGVSRNLMISVMLCLLQGAAFASGTTTVTGTQGEDELFTLKGGTGIGVNAEGNIITLKAEYDPTLETLRKYIKFNADYDSGESLPSVAANSANSFVWGKNAGIYVYSLAEKSEKNIAIGSNAKIFAGNMSNPSKNTGSNTAIGADAVVGSANIYATYSTVVGTGAKSYGASNVVVGNSQAGLNQQIGTKSDGTKIWANAENAVVVGAGAAVYSDKGTAVGGAAIAGKKPTRTDYTDRSQAENAKITYTTAVGYGAHAFGMNSTAVGSQTIATGQQNISLGTGSEARKDNTMSVGFHAVASATDATAIGHDAVVFGDGGLAIGHLVFTSMPALDGYRNNNLDESYLASPEGMKISGDSKIFFRTDDGTVLKYEVKIGNNGEENGKYYKVIAVPNGNGWKFVKVNAAGEQVADNSPDAVQYVAKESMKKDTRTSGKVNHIDYFYIAGQEDSTKLYPTDEGVAIGTYVSTEGSRAMAIGMSSTAHDANNTALGLYSNTFGKDAVAIGHATLTGARGLIETNANTGEHTITYKVLNHGISERTTIDGTVVPFDKNFAYEFSDGTNTLKVQNGKVVAVGNNAYTQTGMKLASDNTAVYRDDATGYLYYTSSGVKHLVKPDENIIINGSGGALTVSAGKMMLSNGGLAIGSYTHAEGDRSLAFGHASGAVGKSSVAVGKFANAYGEGSIALGSEAVAGAQVTTNADGHKVLAISNKTGQPVMDGGKPVSGAIAFGNYAHATANNSLAFGTDAEATGKNSVAIGAGSVSDVENTVSVGSEKQTRTIVNVTAGVDDTDAVNVSQLKDRAAVALDNITDAGKAVITGLTDVVAGDSNISVSPDTDSGGKKTYTLSVSTNGAVIDNNTGIVTGGTVYNALQAEARPAADGNYITTTNTAGANLTALDTAIKANENAMDGKANVALDNITDGGKTVVRELAKEAVKVVNGTKTTVTEGADGNAKTYAVNVTVDGVVEDGNTGIVDGGTVYNALQAEARPATDGNYITTANTAGANLTALDTKVKANENAIADLGDGKANVALDNITDAGKTVIQNATNVVSGDDIISVASSTADGVKTYTVTANIRADGAVESGNTGLVSGDTVYNEVRPDDGNYVTKDATTAANLNALDTKVKANENAITELGEGKANVALDNITDDGKTVIRNLAKESVKVVNGTNTTVTEGTDGNAKTYAVSVTVDGVVESGNTGIVDGGTVYDALQDQKDVIDDALDSKANRNASNVAAYAADWGAAIGTGAVASGNGELVTGGTVYNALQAEARPAADGNYITTTNTAGANLTALDTALKDVSDIANEVKDDLNGKANVALDNISDDGKTVVRELAKEAVKVVAGTNTTVTEGTDGNARTYAVNVTADGVVENGNTGIVDGGTVYNAIKDTKDEINDSLDTKANKDASNVAAYAADWGAAIGTGAVASGNGELVTGGTVYNALQAEARPAADGNYITTTNTAGANLTALDTALKDVSDIANEVKDDLNGKANVALDNISDDGKTVVRELAKEAVKVVAGTNTTVTEGTDGNARTYAVNVTIDGAVEDGNTGLVTGGDIYNAIQKSKDPNAVQYDDDGHTSVTLGGTSAADPVALKNVADGSVASNSKDAVNGGQLFTVQKLARDAMDGLDGKANISLDNIDNSGKKVITDLAKESVVVEGEKDIYVTSQDVGTQRKFVVGINAKGKVEEGNDSVVTGGEVYRSLTPIKEDLATKADADAGNIDDDAWALRLGKGRVEENDGNLVTGGTVYEALSQVDEKIVVRYKEGTIYMGASKDGNKVDIHNKDGEGRVITGVMTDGSDPSSAVNVSYVDALAKNVDGEIQRTNARINEVGAQAAAMASLMPAATDGDEKWSVSASVGSYHNEAAAALGLFYKPKENIMLNLRGTVGNHNNMVGGGVSIALDRGFSMGLTKAKLAQAVNSQAQIIDELKAERDADRARMEEQEKMIAEQNRQIAELRTAIQNLAKK